MKLCLEWCKVKIMGTDTTRLPPCLQSYKGIVYIIFFFNSKGPDRKKQHDWMKENFQANITLKKKNLGFIQSAT